MRAELRHGRKEFATHASLRQAALDSATATETSGLNNQMWATVVDRDWLVCAVAYPDVNRGAQWPGSRAIAAQKANTAVAYQGPSANYGTASDPMVGQKMGGVNVFGGGLALYRAAPTATSTPTEQVVGGVGVSGDTSCADHFIGWRVRHNLGLDHLANTAGVSGDPTHPDNIIFDITPNPYGGTGISAGGFGHPTCINTGNPATLPVVIP